MNPRTTKGNRPVAQGTLRSTADSDRPVLRDLTNTRAGPHGGGDTSNRRGVAIKVVKKSGDSESNEDELPIRPLDPKEYNKDYTLPQLRALCDRDGITYPKSTTKRNLIDRIVSFDLQNKIGDWDTDCTLESYDPFADDKRGDESNTRAGSDAQSEVSGDKQKGAKSTSKSRDPDWEQLKALRLIFYNKLCIDVDLKDSELLINLLECACQLGRSEGRAYDKKKTGDFHYLYTRLRDRYERYVGVSKRNRVPGDMKFMLEFLKYYYELRPQRNSQGFITFSKAYVKHQLQQAARSASAEKSLPMEDKDNDHGGVTRGNGPENDSAVEDITGSYAKKDFQDLKEECAKRIMGLGNDVAVVTSLLKFCHETRPTKNTGTHFTSRGAAWLKQLLRQKCAKHIGGTRRDKDFAVALLQFYDTLDIVVHAEENILEASPSHKVPTAENGDERAASMKPKHLKGPEDAPVKKARGVATAGSVRGHVRSEDKKESQGHISKAVQTSFKKTASSERKAFAKIEYSVLRKDVKQRITAHLEDTAFIAKLWRICCKLRPLTTGQSPDFKSRDPQYVVGGFSRKFYEHVGTAQKRVDGDKHFLVEFLVAFEVLRPNACGKELVDPGVEKRTSNKPEGEYTKDEKVQELQGVAKTKASVEKPRKNKPGTGGEVTKSTSALSAPVTPPSCPTTTVAVTSRKRGRDVDEVQQRTTEREAKKPRRTVELNKPTKRTREEVEKETESKGPAAKKLRMTARPIKSPKVNSSGLPQKTLHEGNAEAPPSPAPPSASVPVPVTLPQSHHLASHSPTALGSPVLTPLALPPAIQLSSSKKRKREEDVASESKASPPPKKMTLGELVEMRASKKRAAEEAKSTSEGSEKIAEGSPKGAVVDAASHAV
ncbi:hypothetical protein BU16DRAFT_556427 [Lophium mytilinum]|uniref:Uncharacterized protein n=1 Tax=Lophium mytilinum TaxID=390894 RepID=A0A6A6R646_9PEZI|nr:hypothetical protein BU16DRAFT_556427 [Lophium mytilinum]